MEAAEARSVRARSAPRRSAVRRTATRPRERESSITAQNRPDMPNVLAVMIG